MISCNQGNGNGEPHENALGEEDQPDNPENGPQIQHLFN